MDLSRLVVARYLLDRLNPTLEVPRWVLAEDDSQVLAKAVKALAPNPVYTEAKISINAMLESFLRYINKAMGDKYRLGVSESRGRGYYFFTGQHQLDSFALMVSLSEWDIVELRLEYVPFDLNHKPELSKKVSVSERAADPQIAGMALMRAARKMVPELKKRRLIAKRPAL